MTIKNTTVIKSALPIGRTSLDEKTFAEKYAKRVRKGKTARDHANGAKARNEMRKQARAAWQQDSRSTPETFPQ
jgi:hypothetical protein